MQRERRLQQASLSCAVNEDMDKIAKIADDEEFRMITEYPSYCVSSYGRVINVKTKRVMKTGISKGYYQVSLYNENIKKSITVHKLVSTAFIGERPDDFVVDHINQDKLNNNVINLRYITRTNNNKNQTVKGGITKDKSRDSWEVRFPILNNDNTVTNYRKRHKTLEDAQLDLERLRNEHSNRTLNTQHL